MICPNCGSHGIEEIDFYEYECFNCGARMNKDEYEYYTQINGTNE